MFERGLHTDAETFLHYAHAACPDDEENLVVADILWNLAGIRNENNRIQEALSLCLRVLKIREALLPPSDPVLSSTYYSIAIVYMEDGQSDKSLEYSLKALLFWENCPDENQSSKAFALGNLGIYYRRMHNLEKASNCMERAENLWRKSCGPVSDRFAM